MNQVRPDADNASVRLRSAVLDSAGASLYKPRRSSLGSHLRAGAQVAQLVEHVTENHGVGGSIPPLGTISFPPYDPFAGPPGGCLLPRGAAWTRRHCSDSEPLG